MNIYHDHASRTNEISKQALPTSYQITTSQLSFMSMVDESKEMIILAVVKQIQIA